MTTDSIGQMKFLRKFYLYAVSLLLLTGHLNAQPQPYLGDLSDGSRATPVHLIQLIDEDSSVIRPDEQPLLPFSPKNTCGGGGGGKCHDYEKIKLGWHFNATDSVVLTGRPGVPWIYTDQQTFTQIPFSYRAWPGVYQPQQMGMTTLRMIQVFGRQMTGGGPGELEQNRALTDLVRWQVSGNLEINCLSCHDAGSAHDQAEYAAQTARQNFRWAAAAASGFAFVRGTAAAMPDNYDLYWGVAPDQPQDIPPQVFYDISRFNYKQEVFFDVTCDIPNRNCYFCHSTKIVDSTRSERWQMGEDVHLAAGMKCVDCHRNGLDHRIIRGYEGEINAGNRSGADLTCAGCHLPKSGGADRNTVVVNAPRPAHRGIPLIHFNQLTCTACHAGEWPVEKSRRIKTAITHGLGVKGINKSDRVLPHVISPVLAEQADGKLAPHNMIWPVFWAYQHADTLVPIPPSVMLPEIRNIIVNDDSSGSGNWLSLNDSLLIRVLDTLRTKSVSKVEPVFIAGGKLYRLDSNRKLVSIFHVVAEPYRWPLAHNVRPAVRALGQNGCADCHALSAPFTFGKVEIDTPLESPGNEYRRMIDFRSRTRIQALIFSFSFLFRPFLKYLILVAMGIITAVVMLYGFKGLALLVKVFSGEE
jgi:hypothetical protein